MLLAPCQSRSHYLIEFRPREAIKNLSDCEKVLCKLEKYKAYYQRLSSLTTQQPRFPSLSVSRTSLSDST